jgi:hypothetical protein
MQNKNGETKGSIRNKETPFCKRPCREMTTIREYESTRGHHTSSTVEHSRAQQRRMRPHPCRSLCQTGRTPIFLLRCSSLTLITPHTSRSLTLSLYLFALTFHHVIQTTTSHTFFSVNPHNRDTARFRLDLCTNHHDEQMVVWI